MRRGAVFLLLAVLALASPALAADLRLGLAVEPGSIDPHYHNFGGNKSLMPNLFDALTSIDAQDRLGPGLAVAWKLVDDTTWEFKLRDGVTFSDGTPFTADDVAFTIERVPNVPTTVTDMSEYVKPIARVEVVDRLTVAVPYQGAVPARAGVSVGDRHRVAPAWRGREHVRLQQRQGEGPVTAGRATWIVRLAARRRNRSRRWGRRWRRGRLDRRWRRGLLLSARREERHGNDHDCHRRTTEQPVTGHCFGSGDHPFLLTLSCS